MEDVFEGIAKSLHSLHNEVIPLAAIWLKSPCVTGEGRTIRLAEGATVLIENDELKDIPPGGKPTHRITETRGTLYNKFEIDAVSLLDNSIINIKL